MPLWRRWKVQPKKHVVAGSRQRRVFEDRAELNYRAFVEKLPGLLVSHQGFALMRDGEIVELFDTVRDTYIAGQKLFKDDPAFSIPEVVEAPLT
jgi:hypothetical protein